VFGYLRSLRPPKVLLWCYLIWYAFVVVRYFEPTPALWGTSLGMSAIIGSGLYLSTAYATGARRALGVWPVFRFYLMPFCVSSFAALVKGRHFVLIFHPELRDNATALALCGGFVVLVAIAKSRLLAGEPLKFDGST
jgi:hypothetical protein